MGEVIQLTWQRRLRKCLSKIKPVKWRRTMAVSKETGQFIKLAIDKDPALVPKALDIMGTPKRDKCPACDVLRSLAPEGEIVCKVCGRDDIRTTTQSADTTIDKLGGNDLSLEEDV
jgi:hypothetical protein